MKLEVLLSSMQNPYSFNSGVYALELEDGCYYVGYSEDLDARLQKHRNCVTAWTKKHPPVAVDDVFPARFNIKQLEKEVTLQYMKEHGWKKVRGAAWTQVERDTKPVPLR
jgi:predicted GIY-YIG superfamily endonuclease